MRFTIGNMPNIDPVEFIGGVFPRRQVSIIASEPGCGKTWVMLKFCADISNDWHIGKFFGQSWGYEKKRKSVMFVGDTGKEMIVDRINKLKLEYTSEPDYIFYFVSDLISAKYNFLLNTDEGKNNIQSLVHYEQPDIVFFDTLISFMTGDENSAKDIGEIFIFLRNMAEMENCAVVINHHFRKTSKGEGHRKSVNLNDVIGSSAMSRLASLMIGMVRNRDIENRNIVDVSCVKTWYREPRNFSFEIISDGEDSVIIEPDYYKGNMMTLKMILDDISRQTKEGEITRVLDIAEMVNARVEHVKEVMMRSPLWSPLTNDKECDKFYPVKQ